MPFDFRGKTAVVTGGANGIGRAAARALAAGRASVFVFDVTGDDENHIAVDVTDRASIDAALAQSGPPDIVVFDRRFRLPDCVADGYAWAAE